jgi:hypothetical protein
MNKRITSGFDKVYVWMTNDGRRIIDLDAYQMDLLQFETLSATWVYHGYDPIKNDPPEKEQFCEDLMYGDDGNGWIEWAKKLGIIRKRTRAEKAEHDSELTKSLDVVDSKGMFYATT